MNTGDELDEDGNGPELGVVDDVEAFVDVEDSASLDPPSPTNRTAPKRAAPVQAPEIKGSGATATPPATVALILHSC